MSIVRSAAVKATQPESGSTAADSKYAGVIKALRQCDGLTDSVRRTMMKPVPAVLMSPAQLEAYLRRLEA
jgi:hypothetical protein